MDMWPREKMNGSGKIFLRKDLKLLVLRFAVCKVERGILNRIEMLVVET